MPENYILRDLPRGGDLPVRLVGLIDDHACTALLNVEKAANKASTSASTKFDHYIPYYNKNLRFVLVIKRKHPMFDDKEPIIFISLPN